MVVLTDTDQWNRAVNPATPHTYVHGSVPGVGPVPWRKDGLLTQGC